MFRGKNGQNNKLPWRLLAPVWEILDPPLQITLLNTQNHYWCSIFTSTIFHNQKRAIRNTYPISVHPMCCTQISFITYCTTRGIHKYVTYFALPILCAGKWWYIRMLHLANCSFANKNDSKIFQIRNNFQSGWHMNGLQVIMILFPLMLFPNFFTLFKREDCELKFTNSHTVM